MHCEGGFFGMLFGLLFWDIIFGDWPRIFVSPYQSAPLDFRSDQFYSTRRAAIEARIRLLQDSATDIPSMVQEAWTAHAGSIGPGVDWDRFTLLELMTMTRCVGQRVVAGVLHLLAFDHRHRRGGQPDLLLYKVQGNQMEAKFVEVKSPNDRLAPKQEVGSTTNKKKEKTGRKILHQVENKKMRCVSRLWNLGLLKDETIAVKHGVI